MAVDEHVERAIQALLDGSPLPVSGEASGHGAAVPEPLCVVDAIARAHRTAIFGSDISPDRPVSARWGHLEIRGEIGRGASGTVYRAWDAKLAREVALKLLSPDAVASSDAHEEARLLARLNHPHIVRVFGADIHDGAHGIWMELLEGDTLDEIVGRDGVFSAEEALLIGTDLAGALSAIHAAGLLHRDVKARNVVRERGGRVVLMDLGAGRLDGARATRHDEAGTPLYMAPEVLASGPATVRTDVYSLGVLLFRLLTGRYPVVADNLAELRSRHQSGGRSSIALARPDLNAEVVAVVDRAAAPDAESRYASAAELESAIGDTLRQMLASRGGIPSPLARRWTRWRKPAAACAAALALTLAAAWAAWETREGRSVRRAAGLTVPPLSTLYVSLSGGLLIVRGRTLQLAAYNPALAETIAVSSDLGVRTISSSKPQVTGGSFLLDGTAVPAPAVTGPGYCCFGDGATDGEFNYAIRQDDIGLDPPGSRALAPTALYRFRRDWSDAQMLFRLGPDGEYYGVAYSDATRSFWVTTVARDGTRVEQWTRDGSRVASFTVPASQLMALAIDPSDGTIWAARSQIATVTLHLENFDTAGRHLASVDYTLPFTIPWSLRGAEFAWVRTR